MSTLMLLFDGVAVQGATYYVGPGGSDGAAGTSYANRWLTIGKALGAAGIASGDTVYITPGTYREVVTVAMTSATATTNIIGDVDGSHTSGAPGPVVWTGYTTNDTTSPSATVVLNLSSRDYLYFSNIMFVAAGTQCVDVPTGSTNITFMDCSFQQSFSGSTNHRLFTITTPASGGAAAHLIERCTFLSSSANATNCTIEVAYTRSAADYDPNIIFRNCLVVGSGVQAVRVSSTGAGAGFGGGAIIENCTMIGSGAVVVQDANVSTTYPIIIRNCFIMGSNAAFSATTSGQIVESYNIISGSGTIRTNVSVGTGSASTYSVPLTLGMERLWGANPRPFFTPLPSTPMVGFGSASAPTTDILNRVRPSGGASLSTTAGAFERHDFGTKEITITDASGVAIRLTGPGDHQLLIPVNAVSTTISVKVYYDTNHAATNKPQATLVANGEIGYAGQTVTATAGINTWDTITFSAFTPSAKSVVTLRLISRSAAGNGYAIFDTINVV